MSRALRLSSSDYDTLTAIAREEGLTASEVASRVIRCAQAWAEQGWFDAHCISLICNDSMMNRLKQAAAKAGLPTQAWLARLLEHAVTTFDEVATVPPCDCKVHEAGGVQVEITPLEKPLLVRRN